jgi:hypothetical protein
MNFYRNQQNAAHYSIDSRNVNIIDQKNWHFRPDLESDFASFRPILALRNRGNYKMSAVFGTNGKR